MKFEHSIEIKFGILQLKVSGFFDEFAKLPMQKFADLRAVIVDCTNIASINSVGILTWVKWFRGVAEQNADVEFTFFGCPRVLVQQMSSIKGFLPTNTHVQSFAAPMHCHDCGTSTTLMLLRNRDYRYNIATKKFDVFVPVTACPGCKKAMEEDFIAASYLKFLSWCVAKV